MIPRRQMQVLHDNQPAGFVTSGSFSPQLNCGIGLALIKRPIATNGTILQLARRNSFYTAEIVARPFFRNPLSKGMHRR
jgi:glycine cleavage system aminomethyltransferase T